MSTPIINSRPSPAFLSVSYFVILCRSAFTYSFEVTLVHLPVFRARSFHSLITSIWHLCLHRLALKMILATAVLLTTFVSLIAGQGTATLESTATATSSSAAQTWTVTVGKGDNAFVVRQTDRIPYSSHSPLISLKSFKQTLET
jgi:hypothetical protein